MTMEGSPGNGKGKYAGNDSLCLVIPVLCFLSLSGCSSQCLRIKFGQQFRQPVIAALDAAIPI